MGPSAIGSTTTRPGSFHSAAGAIPPESAFRYVFTHGADFVLAGMFDFEIAEDARLVREIFPSVDRQRALQA